MCRVCIVRVCIVACVMQGVQGLYCRMCVQGLYCLMFGVQGVYCLMCVEQSAETQQEHIRNTEGTQYCLMCVEQSAVKA